ncbi:hypothetical protein ACQCVE_17990 [Metabacillus sp. 113a]|uniref:hypothetical protein n=1 Tax=Metabacillus sp. 113a TaxID=3404706 RepID=UPI003CF92791
MRGSYWGAVPLYMGGSYWEAVPFTWAALTGGGSFYMGGSLMEAVPLYMGGSLMGAALTGGRFLLHGRLFDGDDRLLTGLLVKDNMAKAKFVE